MYKQQIIPEAFKCLARFVTKKKKDEQVNLYIYE